MKTLNLAIVRPGKWLKFHIYVALLLVLTVTVAGCAGPATPSPTVRPTPPASPAIAPPPPSPSPARYALSIAASPAAGGTVTPSSGTYDRGAQVTLRAEPSGTCWKFDRWSGDVSGTVTPMPLTLDGNKNVTATFVRVKYALSVTVTPAGSGSVGPVSGTYDCGDSVSIVATPAAGYTFDRWSGDASGNLPSTSIAMQSNRSVVAQFRTTYQVIKRDMPAGSGSISAVTVSSQLRAGDRIQGFVELTGERREGDAVFSWNFSITAPLGTRVEDWQGNVLSTQRHDFDKTAPADGIYLMRVSHVSRWPKTLTIQVTPGGWQ